MANHDALNIGSYERMGVTNVEKGDTSFNQGLRLLLAYQHETAIEYFQCCVEKSPYCALAHALIAFCHSPNYNFRGKDYYEFSKPEGNDDEDKAKFPSQLVADHHSRLAVEISEKLNGEENYAHIVNDGRKPKQIKDVEIMLINAIRLLNCNPGVDPSVAEEINDKPFAKAMCEAYKKFPHDSEIAYIYASSIMTLHAWRLYEYPTGIPLCEDVTLIKQVLEKALRLHPRHVGLCHMFCHLCEMSANPEHALAAADVLRKEFPGAGHLVHMSTHIDVLVGDYEKCVRWNAAAIKADKISMKLSPATSNPTSFYFGYIVHDFHMLIYGCILGGFEKKAQETAEDINFYVNETLFTQTPDLCANLESYSAMDVEVLIRFGRWQEILQIEFPNDQNLMLNRAATLRFGRGLAFANLGLIDQANQEAVCFEEIRSNPDANFRILHNNIVSDLLDVDSAMLKGEIAYFSGLHEIAFEELRRAIRLQDDLNYDEPWGKMQPIRHALGGLMLKQGLEFEAEKIFREDLQQHPGNPWSLQGLVQCLQQQLEDSTNCNACSNISLVEKVDTKENLTMQALREIKFTEIADLKIQLQKQRRIEWADYKIIASCACCEPTTT